VSDPKRKSSADESRHIVDFDALLRQVVSKDLRYAPEAYLFLTEALKHTQDMLGRNPFSEVESERHVTGQELLEGIRRYAQAQFGMLAPTVFRGWGVHRTEDFGEMVFNLVEAGLMSKTARDSREDFANGFDFDQAFREPITL
jgi:uncharacterized repeat protein (TIGR04138 family)